MGNRNAVCQRCGDVHPAWYIPLDPVTGQRICGHCVDEMFWEFKTETDRQMTEWENAVDQVIEAPKDDLS